MTDDERTIASLEQRLGHRFADRRLIERALTHTSAVALGADSYQRLEFLGDRVLALTIARMAYDAFPAADEGELARRLNALVRRETCADVGRALDLGSVLRLGAGELQTGGRTKTAILGDVMEAVIAAIYLDGGFEVAFQFVARHWGERMAAARGPLRDAKTTLQEWAQGRGLPTPAYRQVGRSGPDHDPEFTIAVDIAGIAGAEARGRSKREAEQAAAARVLEREGLWKEDAVG
ncbi:MAG: ribonuclease III [Ancalomicrobiaceae bacterium]|nr:ribonuclease III [Ancalomicrobiaceae bacterium]